MRSQERADEICYSKDLNNSGVQKGVLIFTDQLRCFIEENHQRKLDESVYNLQLNNPSNSMEFEFDIRFVKAETNGESVKQKRINHLLVESAKLIKKSIFILDADTPDFGQTRSSLIQNFQNEGLELSQEGIFLLSNNSDNGCLENLLLEVISDKSTSIFRCFESYKDDTQSINKECTKPDLKTKIYAYLEIITSSRSEQPRDYSNPEIWDLQHETLIPLLLTF